MLKRIFLLSLFSTLLCLNNAKAQQKVTVAIAANMRFAMEQLKTEFEKETGISVELITGASGKLAAQVTEGAPYDVFVSADMNYPDALYKKGFATEAPKIYATGLLVLWTAKPDMKLNGDLKMLLNPALKKVAIANPKTAPYGLAAEEALKYYKIYELVKDKLVFGESVGQTQQFIATQAAEVGFIAKSMVMADEMKGKGEWVDVDPRSYSPITQGVVILKHGNEANKSNSARFYNYLFSEKAKVIFRKLGYIVK